MNGEETLKGAHRVQFSRDGRFAYSSSGEVVATTSAARVRLQIDFPDNVPAEAQVRYGLGYVTDDPPHSAPWGLHVHTRHPYARPL